MKHLNKYRARIGMAALMLLSAPAMAGDIVVVMAAGSAPLTHDQVTDLYLGRSAALKPLDLPASNPVRDAFYRKATDRDASQVKAIWARIIFTGQGQPPPVMADAAAVKKAVAADSKAVGYIDKGDLDPSVKAVFELP